MTQRVWVLFQPLIPPFNHHQLRPSAGMSRLATALAATALVPHWWLTARGIVGGWFRGTPRAAANPLSPASPRLKAQSERIASQVVSALDANRIQATIKVSAGMKFAVGCLAP
jgi:hypothetical protein